MGKVGRYAMTKTNIAREYIRNNYFKKDKVSIIRHLSKKTGLKKETIEILYNEIHQQNNSTIKDKAKNTMREQREITKYKGRLRQFFILDDSNLYKGLIDNKEKKV